MTVPVLAYDPSIVQTGFAYLDEDGRLVRSGVIRPKGEADAARLAYLFCRATLDRHALPTGTVALVEIPDPNPHRGRATWAGKAVNLDAQHKCCMAVGALVAGLTGAGVEVLLVPVEAWKGRRAKGADQTAAQAQLGRRVTTDESDAIGLGAWFARNPALARATLAALAASRTAAKAARARSRACARGRA